MSATAAFLLFFAVFIAVKFGQTAAIELPVWFLVGGLIGTATVLINRSRRGGDQ